MLKLRGARRLVKGLIFRASLPPVRRWLRGRWEGPHDVPPVGLVRFGSLRRLEPISYEWGSDRGGPVDRHYIEKFLSASQADISGRVLEIGEDLYTRMFGGDSVICGDILVYEQTENARATYVGDLTSAPQLPDAAFDCVIVTQTLQLIYDVRAAIATIHRVLKPGGVALITAPGITQINRRDDESWGNYWCWNFTALSMTRLFSEYFGEDNVQVQTHGNVLVAAAFLYGLGRVELTQREYDHHDPDYEVIIAVRAQKGVAA